MTFAEELTIRRLSISMAIYVLRDIQMIPNSLKPAKEVTAPAYPSAINNTRTDLLQRLQQRYVRAVYHPELAVFEVGDVLLLNDREAAWLLDDPLTEPELLRYRQNPEYLRRTLCRISPWM